MKNNKKLQFALCIIAIIIAAWFYATPYITAHNIKKAAENGDAQALSEYVNFPAVRNNLKNSVSDMIVTKSGNIASSAAGALTNAFLTPIVNALVTPEGLIKLIRNNEAMGSYSHNHSQNQASDDNQNQEQKNTILSTGYETFDRFAISIKKKNHENDSISFVLERDGLFNWKLTAIRLPESIINPLK